MPMPMPETPRLIELDAAGRLALANALGESPETVMSVHRLRRGLARAWAADGAVVVQGTLLPEEPHVFGDDPEAILALLREVPGWACVNAPEAIAPALARAIERETGRPCEGGPEIYSVQDAPLPPPRGADAARLLLPADLPLLEAATEPLAVRGWRFGSAARLLAEGMSAGVIAAGDLVAVAFTSALGERFAEVGIVTREDARGRGYATAAAAIVCGALHARGILPVWSTAADNLPSRRVAANLGFREVSRRVYVCRG